MSFRNFKYELNEEQVEYSKKVAEYLVKQPEIQSFIEHYNCPEDVVKENASSFKNWLESKRKAESYSREQLEKDPNLGNYINLEYDSNTGIISEVFYQLPLVQEIEKEVAYLKNYEIFDLPLALQSAHFETINLEQENPNYLNILKTMIEFTSDNNLGYFLYGNLGIGKSYICACVSNQFAKNGQKVMYVHVPTLMNTLKQYFNNPSQMEYVLRRLRNVPLLVLDDLGAESITSWSRDEILLSILNDRMENKRKTLITSNYNPDLLVELYKVDQRGVSDEIRAKRLVDRIFSLTQPYEMVGMNRRTKN